MKDPTSAAESGRELAPEVPFEAQILAKVASGEELSAFERFQLRAMRERERWAEEDAARARRRLAHEPEEPMSLPGVTLVRETEMVARSAAVPMEEALLRARRDVDRMIFTMTRSRRSLPPRRGSCGARRGRSARLASNSRRRGSRRATVSRDDGGGDPPGDPEPAGGLARHSILIGGAS